VFCFLCSPRVPCALPPWGSFIVPGRGWETLTSFRVSDIGACSIFIGGKGYEAKLKNPPLYGICRWAWGTSSGSRAGSSMIACRSALLKSNIIERIPPRRSVRRGAENRPLELPRGASERSFMVLALLWELPRIRWALSAFWLECGKNGKRFNAMAAMHCGGIIDCHDGVVG